MKAREVIETSLIILAGLSGLLAIVIAVGPAVGFSAVRLASGSMAPALPVDSLVFVHSVPAGEVGVGDIVMVQRPGLLPVTHRVVGVGPAGIGAPGDAAQNRELTLKGDANPAPDTRPYTVDRVGKVLFGMPWGGQVVTVLRSPVVLGIVTVLATSAILWGVWPHRRRAHVASGARA